MAKAKQSPALFEVITKNRPLTARIRPSLISSITRLFRSNRNGTTHGMPAARSAPAAPPVAPPVSAPAPSPAPIAPVADAGPMPSRRAVITIDPDRYEITLRLSYVSGIICVFAIVTLVAAAFMAGGASSGSRPALAAQPPSQPGENEPRPSLYNIERTPVSVDMPAEGEPAGSSQLSASDSRRPAAQVSRTRKVGLNYVIIQSYPEEAMAAEAIKVLAENGIDCTIEKLPNWSASKNWHTVVGLEGFDKISNSPRYEAYLKKIRDISDKYAKKSSFKAFTPIAYKWIGKSR